MSTTSQKVQGLTLALFGAYGGGYTAELEDAVDGFGLHNVADSLVGLPAVVFDLDLSADADWIDYVLGNLGIVSTSASYDAAVAAMEDLLEAGDRGHAVAIAVEYLLGDTVAAEFAGVAAAFVDLVDAGVEDAADNDSTSIADLRGAAGNDGDAAVPLNLTAALAALEAAEGAVTDYLDAFNEANDAEAASAADIDVLADDAAEVVDDAIVDVTDAEAEDFIDANAANKDALIAVARALLQADVDGAEATLAAKQADIDALEGLQDAIDEFEAADAADVAAAEAASLAGSAVVAALAFAADRAGEDIEVDGTDYYIDEDGEAGYSAGEDTLLVEFDAEDGFVAAGELTDEDYDGLTELVDALNASAEADAAAEDAEADLAEAAEAINDLEGFAAYEAYVAADEAFDAAETALSGFNDFVDTWEGLVADTAELLALEVAVNDAVGVLNGGWNLVELDGGDDEAATAGDDVYTLSAGLDNSITDFGAAGNDLIVIGAGYTLTVVDEEADVVADAVGSVSALEVLLQDTDAGVLVYVEGETFAGTDDSDADLTAAVLLAGVSAADLTLTANGYLVIG